MLGTDLSHCAKKLGHQVIPVTRKECDLTNLDHIAEYLNTLPDFDILINCAAYTKVDECEIQYNLADLINGYAVQKISNFCAQKQIPISKSLIYSLLKRLIINLNGKNSWMES